MLLDQGLAQVALLDERLFLPKAIFAICGLTMMLIAILATLLGTYWAVTHIPFTVHKALYVEGLPDEILFFAPPILFLMAVPPSVCYWLLKRHQRYHVVIVMLLIMLLPYSSLLFLFQIPAAIWVLFVMCFKTSRQVFHDTMLRNQLPTK